jgi:nitrogen fixation NifU-like protein
MDRQEQIENLLDHYEHPRFREANEGADVIMPGGNPGCGDVITIYLSIADDEASVSTVGFEGEGCTISQAAASILMVMAHDEQWTLSEIDEIDYTTMIDILGKEAVQMRPKCATLALGTLKAAVKKYRRDKMRRDAGLDIVEEEDDESAKRLGIVTGAAALQETKE